MLLLVMHSMTNKSLFIMLSSTLDPANRLVAATLERRWNEALERCEALNQQSVEAQHHRTRVATPEQKAQVLALARDFPRLWQAATTRPKDRKRMLRLLIKDITVEKRPERQVVLHIRWQGGACTDRIVHLPLPIAERLRYPPTIVARVRELARDRDDTAIADTLNREGYRSAKGKAFNVSMVAWIRYRHHILKANLKRPEELTVAQVAERFGVSHHVVYYWLTGAPRFDLGDAGSEKVSHWRYVVLPSPEHMM